MTKRFEVLSDTHTVNVADYTQELKYVFGKTYADTDEIIITTLRKIVYSTDETSITAPIDDDVNIQDGPPELFDFLETTDIILKMLTPSSNSKTTIFKLYQSSGI